MWMVKIKNNNKELQILYKNKESQVFPPDLLLTFYSPLSCFVIL